MLIKGIKLFSAQDTQQPLIIILQFGFIFTLNQYGWEEYKRQHRQWEVEKFSLCLSECEELPCVLSPLCRSEFTHWDFVHVTLAEG